MENIGASKIDSDSDTDNRSSNKNEDNHILIKMIASS